MTQRHIAVIAPPWYPVPPKGYGGIELVVYLLVTALRKQGVRVTLIGSEGSLPGTIALAPSEWSADLGGQNGISREVSYVSRVLRTLRSIPDVDVIHDHAGWTSMLACSVANIAPVIHTVHGPLYEPQRTVYHDIDPNGSVGLAAISGAQRASDPTLNWVGTVHNAVDLDALWVGDRSAKEPYLLCLARITPDKGQHHAIEVAKRTGYRLVLAGKVGELKTEHEYFEEQVKPHIDNDRIIYYPNIAGQQKADIIARATALLAPICWPEPFGLSMVEAMVSGTPTIAFAQGAAPELITNGLTGATVDTVDEMVDVIEHINDFDPKSCSDAARAEFSPMTMAERYRELYEITYHSTMRSVPTADKPLSATRVTGHAASQVAQDHHAPTSNVEQEPAEPVA
ncbi:MAG: glycosyltransferase family 4 protein [Candidatus Dormibacteria bacterium]